MTQRPRRPRKAPSPAAPVRAHPHPSFAALRLPEAETEVRFSQTRKFRFDFAWPSFKIALEIEGGAWQYGRHNRASGFLKDMEKYNLATLTGWKVLRYTPQQLESGEAADGIATLFDRWKHEVEVR
jgi:hypothetical protein